MNFFDLNKGIAFLFVIFGFTTIDAQTYIDYQGVRYPTTSSITQDCPTVIIRPFDEGKFNSVNGIIKTEINGQKVEFDCKKIYKEDLTNEFLEIQYEENDTSTYGKIIEQRVSFIKDQISLISEIKELIANYKSLDGREPLGNAQKIYLATLIDHRKDGDIKVLQAAQKAREKNKFDKKLEPLNAILLPKIESEQSYLNNLLNSKDDWEKILQATMTSSCISRPGNYPKGEEWANYVATVKKKTVIANIPNPFLLGEIEVPNPNYEDKKLIQNEEETLLVYRNNDYNYSMQIPSCFKKEYDLFCKNGGSDYDFLYGKGKYEGVLLNVATEKNLGYMYLDGKGIYGNDMSSGVYQKLTKQDGESNKKIISKYAFPHGYLVISNLTYSGKPFTSKFYVFNLRNNVQLRIYIRYPQNMNNEFEGYIQKMIDSIEAY